MDVDRDPHHQYANQAEDGLICNSMLANLDRKRNQQQDENNCYQRPQIFELSNPVKEDKLIGEIGKTFDTFVRACIPQFRLQKNESCICFVSPHH